MLRALPNLETLDNVAVNSEELAEALKGPPQQEEVYEDAYSNAQQQYHQHPSQQQQQQQYRNQSPVREVCIQYFLF